ncbi:probable rhodanese domain-containing dual specificity protein phosphatase [Pollicipes pollicipes]|uniref:probable rhodanese domain-containing dual specificity protein phosphatase n=1 Tax=Pollicipes pollicipes TaxID=41117 RepID=UPI001885106A|nr:probable rhodanese domain-containing dual specificity protein phosphatase [Pollicipes pollicipes]
MDDASEKLKATYKALQEKNLAPVCVSGGFNLLESKFPYMWSSKVLTINTFKNKYLQWYPSLVEDDLMLGRADQATNPNVVYDMRISHIVNLLDMSQLKVFSHVSYLLVPLGDSEDQELLSVLPRIFKFITDALETGGRVLIHCDQGVNRAAAVTLAYLMADKGCTLEDAYFFLESLRPTIQPAYHFLKQLTNYEAEIFGRKLSNIDDLEF